MERENRRSRLERETGSESLKHSLYCNYTILFVNRKPFLSFIECFTHISNLLPFLNIRIAVSKIMQAPLFNHTLNIARYPK